MTCFDWHDQCEEWDALPWLERLKAERPDFRCTLFGIPGKGSNSFWESHPDWIEIGIHGWVHNDPHEVQDWSRDRTLRLLDEMVVRKHFSQGFCAPGWNYSDGVYQALLGEGLWIADHPKNNGRRPAGLRCHLLGSPESYHGHTHNVCGNGIEESWDEVVRLVSEADSFEFVSECVT